MISVAGLDLPSPIELDLPGPTGVDLPGLAEVNLPTPAGVDLLQPASLDVEPANILPAPAALDVEPARSDMQPAAGDMRPARGANVPVPRAIATNAAPSAAASQSSTAYDPMGARRSPTPRDVGGDTNRRPLILALIGIGVLAAVGAGLYAIGVFDPPIEDVQPQSVGRRNAPKETVAPATLATERSADVLAAMAKHTPKAYVEAIALAEAAGDRVGQAEAALRLHVRYGPDAVRRGQAETWLEGYVAQPDPFVQRVVGLAALARNDLAKAEAALVGDDASTRLYRGWLRLSQGRAPEAAVEADAVLVAAPGDLAGLALRHEAKAEIDPVSELPGIEASLMKHAGHPGLTLIAAKSAITVGQLHRGRTWLDGLGTPEGTGQGYAARVLALRGALDEAAGAPGKAALRYAEALAFAPEDTTLGPSRVRALMKAKRTAEASGDAAAIVKSRPGDAEALLLQAEVTIEGGGGDDAITMLDAIEKAAPGLARTSYLRGLVHAMRNEIELGKKAFATALERDPKLDIARIAEARMLAGFGTPDEALKVLEAARKVVSARPGGTPKVEAEILRVRAEILRKLGQTAAALTALDQAVTVAPNDNDAQLARGLLRLDSGQYEAGKADLLAVYERTGNYAGLTAPLGRIFVREANLTELEKLVGNVLEQPEATNEELIVGARLRLAQGKPEEAKALMERLLAASANDWEGHLLMAQSLVETGAYPEALVEIDASVPPTPMAEKHLWRGKILEFNARHGEAPAEYRAALALDPTLHEARFLSGRLLVSKGESKAAEEELLKVVAATDAFPRAYVELARAQKELAQWDKAKANLKIALEKDENLYGAHYLMGYILAIKDVNVPAGIASLEKATVAAAETDQDFPAALLLLGTLHENKDKKAARAAFERLRAVAPKSEQAKTAAKKLKGP